MALGSILPPGYRAFKAVQQQNEQSDLAELQKAKVVQGLLAQMQAEQREKAFAADLSGLGTDPSQEQLAQVAARHVRDPKALMDIQTKSLDRQEAIKSREGMAAATRATTEARLSQEARFSEMQHEARMRGITNDEGRAAEIARHNKVMEGINAQLAELKASAAAKPSKAPIGFRFKADDSGELEPIPGGPKDTAPKDAAKAKGAIQKADLVIASVNEALGQTGPLTTGLPGQVIGMIPGTPAYDLDGTLDTIKANLGFAELQAMRDASPTGGALGQVAIQELMMLQSTLASLKRGLSRPKLEKGLGDVKKHMENWKKAVSEANAGEVPSAPTAAPAPTPAVPSGWTVREKK